MGLPLAVLPVQIQRLNCYFVALKFLILKCTDNGYQGRRYSYYLSDVQVCALLILPQHAGLADHLAVVALIPEQLIQTSVNNPEYIMKTKKHIFQLLYCWETVRLVSSKHAE